MNGGREGGREGSLIAREYCSQETENEGMYGTIPLLREGRSDRQTDGGHAGMVHWWE